MVLHTIVAPFRLQICDIYIPINYPIYVTLITYIG